jgi:hypothetical protein
MARTGHLLVLILMLAGGLVSVLATDLPRLKVSENQRFLVREDGRPFFWLGDTAWELFHRLNREEAEHYLQNRRAHEYTVIQAVVLAELDGLNVPNPYGHVPLENHDPTRPNEDYFAHVDWIVDRANELGLYVGMLPTWGDKWNRKWGVGPEIFNPGNAETFGEWLGNRYRDKGIVWIVGGDRPLEDDSHREIVVAMAHGLRRGDGGRNLITFHPVGGQGSAQYFHDKGWLDFNMRQNGHNTKFTEGFQNTRVDYDRIPVKPVLDGEPIYEDHPVSFRSAEWGHSIASDVRRPLYWNLFSGAFGHTYGHHSVWQMWQQGRDPINNPLMPWREAIEQPGAAQMKYGRRLIESRPFLTRIPDDELIVVDRVPTSVPGSGRYRFVATRDLDGTYAMIYAPVGRPFKVRMGMLGGTRLTAWWFDPRTGAAARVGEFSNQGEREFIPPAPGEMLDWVLVLDDADRRYPPPGQQVWEGGR